MRKAVVVITLTFATCAALAQVSCPPAGSTAASIQEIRKQNPEWENLDDDGVVEVIRQVYYPDLSKSEIACQIGVTLTPPKKKRLLGPIDRWRYNSCRADAAKAPTATGVNQGMQVCREQFDQ